MLLNLWGRMVMIISSSMYAAYFIKEEDLQKRIIETQFESAVMMLVKHPSSLIRPLNTLNSFSWLHKPRKYAVFCFIEGISHLIKEFEKSLPTLNLNISVRVFDITRTFQNVSEKFLTRNYRNRFGHWPIGYRLMCDFWTWKVFEIPEVRELESYLR